jgi:hypothetical protein
MLQAQRGATNIGPALTAAFAQKQAYLNKYLGRDG